MLPIYETKKNKVVNTGTSKMFVYDFLLNDSEDCIVHTSNIWSSGSDTIYIYICPHPPQEVMAIYANFPGLQSISLSSCC